MKTEHEVDIETGVVTCIVENDSGKSFIASEKLSDFESEEAAIAAAEAKATEYSNAG